MRQYAGAFFLLFSFILRFRVRMPCSAAIYWWKQLKPFLRETENKPKTERTEQ